MAAIRFRDLVKMAGTPEPKSLWTDPRNDRDFMRAVKQKRVLTVVQESKRKDFGELGFHQHPNALYFVFPKRLPAEEGKVIGIKYDLAEPGEPADVISREELNRAGKRKRAEQRKPKNAEPVVKTFRVAIRQVAVIERTLEIEAHSKSSARTKAAESMNGTKFDVSKAQIENSIKSVR
jgi:hypothetical protein